METPRRRRRKPKTPLGEWVVSQRESQGWKSEELAHRLGLSDSTIRGWEAGRSIAPGNIEAMERLFGVTAPGTSTGVDQPALAAAISVLTEELQAWRVERESIGTRLAALEGAVSLLTGQAVAASPKRPVPDGTTG